MECPFWTPVRASHDALFSVIYANPGNLLCRGLTKDEADYIVQAINSYEKYKTALERIADDSSFEPCTPIAKQALKEKL